MSSSHSSSETFSAFDPFSGKPLEKSFRESNVSDVENACLAAETAFVEYSQTTPEKRAQFLETIAEQIEQLGETLLTSCHKETALPLQRLTGERGRTTGQLRLFANLLRSGRFFNSIIDHADPERSPVPKPDCRQMQVPIGPVAVFGASNFPLAFSTAGGDTVSALAAGCTVIYKGHPAHPETCELINQAISSAIEICRMPKNTFQLLQGSRPLLSEALVTNSYVSAVGFTGSLKVGRKLFDLAQQRSVPIPFYGELGSVNPVFVFEEKLKQNPQKLAQDYLASLTLGVGQFCTNPGIIIGCTSDAWSEFKSALRDQAKQLPAGTMLTPAMAKHFQSSCDALNQQPRLTALSSADTPEETPISAATHLWELNAKDISLFPQWQEETFGPAGFVINCESTDDMLNIARALDGQLTASLFGTDNELRPQTQLIYWLSRKVGRLIFNAFPTGVEVCHAMQHGGPYPASTDVRSTSVGSEAIKRFLRPLCIQDAPSNLLPDPLQDENPMQVPQLVNGQSR